MHFVQGEDTSDCDLFPHYIDATDGTVVSFTSATHNGGSITVQEDGSIGVSTEATEDNIDTQFKFTYIVSVDRFLLYNIIIYTQVSEIVYIAITSTLSDLPAQINFANYQCFPKLAKGILTMVPAGNLY